MFSSSVASGSICLGCQLRAATRRVAAPIASTAAQTRIRNRRRRYHASRAVKALEDDAFKILEESVTSQPDESSGTLPKKPPKGYSQGPITDDWGVNEPDGNEPTGDDGTWIIRRDPVGRPPLEGRRAPQQPQVEEDRPRTYWKGDTKLIQDFRKITVNTLGQEADIIVLKDGGKYPRKDPPKVDRKSFEKNERAFEDFVDQEHGVSMDIVMDNIEELRPEHRILPAREFKILFDKLINAFTVPQLTEYVKRYLERIKQGDESSMAGTLPGSGSQRPWIVSEMRWIPEVPGALPNVDPSLQGYILKSMPPKQRRVMQLMRECWGMSVQELTHGNGALEVEVRDLEFTLLTLGNQRWLQQITRIYLGQGKGKALSVVKSRNVLRIDAPKAVAETCLDAIDRTLQTIRTKTFSMDKTTFANLDVGVVEELGRLTNSVLSLDTEKNEIQVTWIDYQDISESKLEDLADTVFRLLLQGNPPSNVEHSLKIYPSTSGKARLVEDLASKDKLAWMHRRMRWARVCLPASTPNNALEEAWSSRDEILKYEVAPMPQDFVIPESQLDSRIIALRAEQRGSIKDIVANRVGPGVSPLAFPKLTLAQKLAQQEDTREANRFEVLEDLQMVSRKDAPREEQLQDFEATLREEFRKSSEPDSPIEEVVEAYQSEERYAPGSSIEPNAEAEDQVGSDLQATEEAQGLLEESALADEQEDTLEAQFSEDARVSEEIQTSSETEASEQEQARLENVQMTEDAGVAAEEQDSKSIPEATEYQQTPLDAAPTPPKGWSPFRVRTKAVFGHILHLFQPDWTHAVDTAIPSIKALADSPRTISPLIPPVSKMDLKGWIPYNVPSNMSSMVVMRFVPSNDTSDASHSNEQTNPAPLLELCMKASDEDIIAIDCLRAVARTQVSDVLFPTEVVDVRTTQRLEAELPGAEFEYAEGMAPLTTFLADSYLSIREGKLLTPPQITGLGLPQWMFRDNHHEFIAHKKSLAGSKPEEKEEKPEEKLEEKPEKLEESEESPLRPTSYVFAGLEVHRTLETVYDGWKLTYASIEAGQGGGRRAELTLEGRPGYDKDLRRTEEQVSSQEFLQSVYTLVRGLPGKLIKARKPTGEKVRTTIEWLGAGKKGM